MKKARICLISPGHVASNPRLVKEADALHRAGYQVKVIAADITPTVRPLDKTILEQAPWAYQLVKVNSKAEYIMRRLRQKWAQRLVQAKVPLTLWLAAHAHNSMVDKLAQAAKAEPADLYIAHYIAALPAAAQAAQKYKAKFGFDAEDYHVGELTDTPANRGEIVARDFIERTLLPRCVHRTASSPLIAKAYAERYGVTMEPILNVFPLCEAPPRTERSLDRSADTPFTLYWFSQTIGSDRGLEAILQVMARIYFPVQIVLRGSTTAAPGFIDSFFQLAQELGVAGQIQILPTAAPDQMAKLAVAYDIGLSIEQNQPYNRAICLTNKIFTYLLAGIPVLLSRTPAQEQLAQKLGEAALLVDLNNSEQTAQGIEQLFSNPAKLTAARCKAWQLARERYNWDVEQQRLLNSINLILGVS